MSAPFRSPDIPDFSAPAPDMVRVAVSGPSGLTRSEARSAALAAARVELLLAEAALNGLCVTLGERDDYLGEGDPREILRKAAARVFDARNHLDTMRFAALGIETLSGSEPNPNDQDDLLDACLTQLERIEAGVFDDEAEVDSGLIRAACRRGAEVADLIGEAA